MSTPQNNTPQPGPTQAPVKDKTFTARHNEHLDQVFTAESVPAFLASIVVHLVVLVGLVFLPEAETGATQPNDDLSWIGQDEAMEDLLANALDESTTDEILTHRDKNTEDEIETIKYETDRIVKENTGHEDALESPDHGIAQNTFQGLGGASGFRGVGSGMENLFRGNKGMATRVGRLKGKGVDVVLVFDSTDSMRDVIAETKANISRIVNLVQALVPKARFGMVTYRDTTDIFVAKWIELGKPLDEIKRWLDGIQSSKTVVGDDPEAVLQGITQAIEQNSKQWRPTAHRIIILIGDAPPHQKDMDQLLATIKEFHSTKRQISLVNVIDTGSDRKDSIAKDAFKQIARAGGGTYATLGSTEKLTEEIIIQIFGRRYEADLKQLIRKWKQKQEEEKLGA